MGNNRKRTKGRCFNYQPVLEDRETQFGIIKVIKPKSAKKVFQVKTALGKSHNAPDNATFNHYGFRK